MRRCHSLKRQLFMTPPYGEYRLQFDFLRLKPLPRLQNEVKATLPSDQPIEAHCCRRGMQPNRSSELVASQAFGRADRRR